MTITKKFTFIDLFAGIGGMRIAFENLGGECVFSSEWDKFAVITYERNFGEKPHGDITKIDSNDIPDHDILCAGFPCQAFSIAGKRLGFEDIRGTLFFDVARIIRDKQPKAFLLENVIGLKSHDNGNTFKVILNTLNDLRYYVKYNILNAKDFGVPQSRRRIYIVGFSDKNVYDSFTFPTPLDIQTVVGDILEQNVDEKYYISEEQLLSIKIRKELQKQKGNGFGGYKLVDENSNYTNTLIAGYYKNITAILVNDPKTNRPIRIGLIGNGGQGERIYHPHGQAITLSAYGGGIGAKTGLYLVEGNVRKLTPRECARLQGFPESFIIQVSDTQAYKQFGNSVAIPVINAIGRMIFRMISVCPS